MAEKAESGSNSLRSSSFFKPLDQFLHFIPPRICDLSSSIEIQGQFFDNHLHHYR